MVDSITELITFTNGTINDQIQGTTIFHTVTSLHINGTAAAQALQVGVNGRAAGQLEQLILMIMHLFLHQQQICWVR